MLLARLPLIFALLLTLSLASVFSWQIYQFYKDYKNPSSNSATRISQATPLPQVKRTPVRTISKYKLFGDSAAKPVVTAPVVKDLPKTKLKLTLTGVMTSEKQEEASALIQGPDKETLYYRVEDELPGGAILKQVYADRVVVERSGKLENLIFVEQRPIGIESIVDYRDEEPEQDVSSAAINKTPTKSKKTATNPARTQGIKERLSKLRKKMLRNRPNP